MNVETTKSSELSQQEASTCLNALLTGYQLLECLDGVQETTLYRHGLKVKLKALLPELEKFSEGVSDIWGVEDSTMYELMRGRKELVKQIVLLRPELQNGLNELVKQFVMMPELFLKRNGIKID